MTLPELICSEGQGGYRRFAGVSPSPEQRERLTNCTVDGVAGFRRLVAGGPSAGREFSDSIDRKIGQAREHRAQVVADR